MRVPLTIFLGGANLILIQWIMVRELTMLLFGTELIVLLVSTTYFLGLSAGYMLSGRINQRWLMPLAVATLILHLVLPIVVRLLSGWLYAHHLFWIAFILLPLLPLTVSAFYSILLPLFIDKGTGRLLPLYTLEITGAICGLVALIILSGSGLVNLYIVYTVGLLALIAALGLVRGLLVLCTLAAVVWLGLLPTLDASSTAYWYWHVYDSIFSQPPHVIFSASSPYQKVDIIEDANSQRYLFLNGLIDYGTSGWKRLNVVLGEVPARLVRPASMVTVGSGSMALEGLAAPFAGKILTVELDPVVLNASKQYFASENHVDQLTNWSYTIDDAKHFFATTTEHYDLVTMNVPAPFTAQTATLYSDQFYASVKAKLVLRGVIAVSLTDRLTPDNIVARRIAAGVLAEFPQVLAVTPSSVGITFLFASDRLPFTDTDLRAALVTSGEQTFAIMDETALRVFVGDAQPIKFDNLSIALEESAQRIRDLFTGRS